MSIASTALSPELSGNVFLDGPNFSGRTDLVRTITGFGAVDNGRRKRRAYVGPEVYNAISGLRATVGSELALSGAGDCEELEKFINLSILFQLKARNPFTLSGGEQALLAIVAAMANGQDVCGIDCAAEQLDEGNRQRLFQWVAEHPPRNGAIRLMVDNRSGPGTFETCVQMRNSRPKAHQLHPCALHRPAIDVTSLGMDDVWFRYSKNSEWVFRGCSIELQAGHIYVLKGPNGAGKSTWAKLLTGVLKPAKGQVTSAGKYTDIWRRPGQLVGYHFQNPDLQLFCDSVEQELRQNPVLPVGLEREISEALGLYDLLPHHPLDLPFVLRKRVALAATLSMLTPWVIFDEPVLGQDKTSALAIANILKSLANVGTGLIIISHCEWFDDLFDATHLSIEGGQIISRGEIHDRS